MPPTRSARKALWLLPLLGAMCLVPVTANAQASSPVAEALFQEGRELMAADKVAEACAKFQQSQDLESKVGTLLNLAVCHEKQGRTATAWAEFKSAAAVAKREGNHDRAGFAKRRADALEGVLSYLKVTHAALTKGLVVEVDGVAFSLDMLRSPIPVDPGAREVSASAPGKRPWSVKVDVKMGPIEQPVSIPALEDAPSAPTPVAASAPPAQPQTLPESPPTIDTTDDGLSPLIFVGAAVAGAGVLVGGITGAMSIAGEADLAEVCTDGVCPSDQADALSEAETLANVSNVAFAFAAAGAIVGVVGIVLSLDDDEQDTALVVSPTGVTFRTAF